MNQSVQIRSYQPKDKDRVRAICKETAWDSYKKNPNQWETVPVMFLDYFIEHEPDLVFVAVNEKDEAVGYIECSSVSYHEFAKTMKKEYFPVLRKLEKKQIRFQKNFLFALFLIKKNPVHLHIDITQEYQHMGIGKILIQTLIEELKKRNIHSLSICAISRQSAGYPFYRHLGFEEIRHYGKDLVSLNKKI